MPASAMRSSPVAAERRHGTESSQLLVTWQDPVTRTFYAVGILRRTSRGYAFAYFRRAARIEGFQPLPGFPELDHSYHSPHLFPLFSQRVIHRARPDRARWLNALDLADDADPMDLMARSGGHRHGDGLELLPVPTVADDGATSATFMVHGVRYHPGASEKINLLRTGDRLDLTEAPNNPVDQRALLVSSDGQPLGWVPAPLLDYVHVLWARAPVDVTVVRANPPDLGPHLRLLVRLTGVAPAGYVPFGGPEWALASEPISA